MDRILLFLPAVALGVLHAGTLATIVRGWFTHALSYGLIIFLFSAYMVWAKRERLRALPVRPDLAVGSLLTLAGSLLLLVGSLTKTLYLQQASLLVSILGIIRMTVGAAVFRETLLPVAYLTFMFPIFSDLLGGFHAVFQRTSAGIAAILLGVAGIPVLRDGITLVLPHVVLEVARECSGVNSIVALVAIAVPLAFLTLDKAWKKAVLSISALLAGVASNGLRIFLIGLWTQKDPAAAVHGPVNTLIVSTFVMGAGLGVLILLSMAMRNRGGRGERTAPRSPAGIVPAEAPLPQRARAAAVALVILGATGALLHLRRPVPSAVPGGFSALPRTVGAWTGEDVGTLGEPFEDEPADRVLKRVYRRTGDEVPLRLYVAFMGAQDYGRKVFNYRYNILHEGAEDVAVGPGAGTARLVKASRRIRNGRAESYFFCYVIRRVTVGSRSAAKWALLRNAVLHRDTGAAIVILSVPAPNPGDPAAPARPDRQTEIPGAFLPAILDALET